MKYVNIARVKEEVLLRNLVNGKAMLDEDGRELRRNIFGFVRHRLCDPIFGSTAEFIRAQDKIAHEVDDVEAAGGDWLAFEDADYKVLLQVTTNPHPGRPHDSRCVRCEIPFIDALACVENEDPRRKPKPAVEAPAEVVLAETG